jgi:hypothetical protein
VAPARTRWAWKGKLPLGAVSLLVGVPGLGKSTVAVGISAHLTRGALDGDLKGEPRSVLYATGEDHLSATLRPRLEASDADLDRVHFVTVREDGGESLLDLPEDIELLEDRMSHVRPALLVLDPFVAFLSGQIDSHRDHHVRRALAPLAQLAAEHGVAVLAIVHLNKDQNNDVLRRVSGSGGFGGAARSVLAFGHDPDDDDTRVLVHAKSNLGPLMPSLAYRIETKYVASPEGEAIETSQAVEIGPSEVTKDDLLDVRSSDDRLARDEAQQFLLAELSDGPRPSTDIAAAATELGISDSTLRRAKQKLQIKAEREGGIGSKGRWLWRLAPKASTKVATPESDHLRHLRREEEEVVTKLSKASISVGPKGSDRLSATIDPSGHERRFLTTVDQALADGTLEELQ